MTFSKKKLFSQEESGLRMFLFHIDLMLFNFSGERRNMSETKYCPNCASINETESVFCGNCGSNMNQVTSPTPTVQPIPQYPPQQTTQRMYSTQYKPIPQKSSLKSLLNNLLSIHRRQYTIPNCHKADSMLN